MKRNMGLLSHLLGVSGIGMLFLSGALGLSILTLIGLAMVAVGIVGSLVSNAIEEKRDPRRPDDGFQKPPMDKGQLPLGGYTRGPK
jgi:hypothetical protein